MVVSREQLLIVTQQHTAFVANDEDIKHLQLSAQSPVSAHPGFGHNTHTLNFGQVKLQTYHIILLYLHG